MDTVAQIQQDDHEQNAPTWRTKGSGISGNPKGRKKGSRNQLAESFIADLYDDWQQRGPSVIARVASERPHEYLKIIAGLLPKDVNLKIDTLQDLSDEQILRKLAALTEAARPMLERMLPAPSEPLRNPMLIDEAEYTEISSA